LKLHSAEFVEDQPLNGHNPEPDEPDEEEGEEEKEKIDWSDLFRAPNYSDFIRTKPNSNAQKYEARVASLMKAGLMASINAENYPDAATFLKHGPKFSKAAGNLAADNAQFAGLIDIITAPESSTVMFALAAIPLFAQLWRNHQSEVSEAASTFSERRKQRKTERKQGIKPPVTVNKPIRFKLFRRQITIPIRLRIKLPNPAKAFKAFLAPTEDPRRLAYEILGDPKVQNELRKMGIYPAGSENG
jgi:hypothetical protein